MHENYLGRRRNTFYRQWQMHIKATAAATVWSKRVEGASQNMVI